MPLISVIIWIAVIGVVVWLIVTYVPMPQPFKTIIIVIAVLFIVLWFIQILGIVGPTIGPHR
ncbi:MAG: hypothetical protein C5B60_07805 [Chloroflexi bacterium]|nr:MAG: hypothetical protein C5B60_07805 [Chloroflexota bacterium]